MMALRSLGLGFPTKLKMPDLEANCGNNLYHIHVGFGPLQVTSQQSRRYGGGLPSDRMLQAEEGPIALLIDPNLRTPLIGPRHPGHPPYRAP
jgi:hypothetical protein